MGKTKLHIHIGTWKTGSSTIQYHLKHKTSELRSEGIFYHHRDTGILENYKDLEGLQHIDQDLINESRERLKNILETEGKNGQNWRYLMSSEHFSGNPFIGFSNAHIIAETLWEITKDLDLDIYIIVYLRRQDDFIESMYTQSIHLGDSHSFEEFINGFDESAFDWESILDSYSKWFGKDRIIARRYHKAFLPEENSLVQEFGSIIGSDFFKNFTSTNSRNRGLSRDALEITRITNKYFDPEMRYQLRNIFQEVNSKEPFEQYSFFTGNSRSEFLSRYSASNARIAKNYFNSSDGSLFPEDDLSLPRKEYKELTNEAIALNLAKAVLSINQRLTIKERKLQKEFGNMFLSYRIRRRIADSLTNYPNLKSRLSKIVRRD